MTKSTWECPVVDLTKKESHPTGDNLSILRLYDGAYTVVFNTEQWAGKTRAAFIPGQNYVDTTKVEFTWMANKVKAGEKYALVKPAKFRGIKSDGILCPVPEDAIIGEDWANKLGVIHKEDEPEEANKDCVSGPSGVSLSKYDIDGAKYFIKDFQEDWDVVISEKIHGGNHSFLFKDDTLYVKGRTQFLAPSLKHNAYIALAAQPQIEEFCRANIGLALYGEVYGFQTPYNYGLPAGVRRFIAFDIRRLDGSYLDYLQFKELCTKFEIPICPELYLGKWNHELVVDLSKGPSILGGTKPKEGVVVKPIVERQNRRFDRAIYKVISPEYAC